MYIRLICRLESVHLTLPPHIFSIKVSLEHVTLRVIGGEFRIK